MPRRDVFGQEQLFLHHHPNGQGNHDEHEHHLHLHLTHVTGALPFLNPTHAAYRTTTSSSTSSSSTSSSSSTTSQPTHPQIYRLWRARDTRKGRHALRITTSPPPQTHAPEPAKQHPIIPPANPTTHPRTILHTLKAMLTTCPYWDLSYLVAVTFTLGSAIWIVNAFFVWLPLQDPGTGFPGEEGAGGGWTAFVGAGVFEVGSWGLLVEALVSGHPADPEDYDSGDLGAGVGWCWGWDVSLLGPEGREGREGQGDEGQGSRGFGKEEGPGKEKEGAARQGQPPPLPSPPSPPPRQRGSDPNAHANTIPGPGTDTATGTDTSTSTSTSTRSLVLRPSTETCICHHSNRKGLLSSSSSSAGRKNASAFATALTISPAGGAAGRTATTTATTPKSPSRTASHYLHDLGFWASLTQLVGATVFWIAGVTGLPGILGHMSAPLTDGVYWVPQVVGGVCFVVSGGLFTLETQERWDRPAWRVLGWHIGVWNVVGGVGFTLCGVFGLAGMQYQACLATFWGSWAFLWASALQWYESLQKWPVEVEKHPHHH